MTTPDATASPAAALSQTPLKNLHLSLGARMGPFAGWELPIQYPDGLMAEHAHTRAAAGLFDVSHMGRVILTARSGDQADAAAALERLVPTDVAGLPPGRQRYGLFTNAEGGINDDLMIANLGFCLFLVVNGANAAEDIAHLRAHLSDDCHITPLPDHALIALQGPKAEDALAAQIPGVRDMRFMDARAFDDGHMVITRSGYTGEDGFEISLPGDQAEAFARALLDHPEVKPIGLGARDSLRLEAGLPLHGSDIDPHTSPIEAVLGWSIGKARRPGGARAGGFPGSDVIFTQLANGAPRRRIGLKPEGRAPIRGGTMLYIDETATDSIGQVTSGGFGPTVGGPVAMGIVDAAVAKSDRLYADRRGKRLPVAVVSLPFVPATYKR